MTAVLNPTTCPECSVEWPDEPSRPSFSHGPGGCRSCKREYHRRWASTRYSTPEGRRSQRRRSNRHYKNNREAVNEKRLIAFLSKLGVTIDEYREVLEKQDGVCAICRKPETGRFGRLAVDHDHETGEFRGLLCHVCNKALGLLKDNPDALRRAIDYLSTERV